MGDYSQYSLSGDQVADLAERMLKARESLEAMSNARAPGEDSVRLKGKAQGVSLVMSYMDEALRMSRTYETETERASSEVSAMEQVRDLIALWQKPEYAEQKVTLGGAAAVLSSILRRNPQGEAEQPPGAPESDPEDLGPPESGHAPVDPFQQLLVSLEAWAENIYSLLERRLPEQTLPVEPTPPAIDRAAHALAHHYQVELGKGECACGHVVPLGGLFTEHLAKVAHEATIRNPSRAEGDE